MRSSPLLNTVQMRCHVWNGKSVHVLGDDESLIVTMDNRAKTLWQCHVGYFAYDHIHQTIQDQNMIRLHATLETSLFPPARIHSHSLAWKQLHIQLTQDLMIPCGAMHMGFR
jgi:hypothetical protein